MSGLHGGSMVEGWSDTWVGFPKSQNHADDSNLCRFIVGTLLTLDCTPDAYAGEKTELSEDSTQEGHQK